MLFEQFIGCLQISKKISESVLSIDGINKIELMPKAWFEAHEPSE